MTGWTQLLMFWIRTHAVGFSLFSNSIEILMTMGSSIEDETSWELYQSRTQQNRRLHSGERPAVHHDTQHCMMIDAGSQGTRIHLYEFEARILSHRKQVKHAVSGKKLSFPTTDTRWTNRLKPGLDVFAFVMDDVEMKNQVEFYLTPLLQFAKDVLAEKQDKWQRYPIYLKATGGLRTLPRPYRLRLIETVRGIFSNTSFNPFFFENEHARVISGEEEAIYGWTAVNFVKETLLKNSEGTGSVLNPGLTYGVLEMGGASTQIGFFEPYGDVMANLFKLQIGAAKHWNVYAHSFLYFGINGAFARLNARLYTEASMAAIANNDTNSINNGVYNPCLPGGSHYLFTSRVHLLENGTLLPLSTPDNPGVLEADMYSAIMRNDNARGDFGHCSELVYKLLRKDANSWCNFAHDQDCSFAGIYQPPLPIDSGDFGEFIATSNFYDVYAFLGLGDTAPLSQVREGARNICSMSLYELEVYNAQRANPISDVQDLVQYCFRATFVASFLIDGAGFPETYNVTAIDVLNGQKLGWALGSTLYEINTLPWEFKGELLDKVASKFTLGMFTSSDGEVSFDSFSGVGAILLVLILGTIGTIKFLLPRRRTAFRHEPVDDESLALRGSAPISEERRSSYGAM